MLDALKLLFKDFILYNVVRVLSVVVPSLKNHPYLAGKLSPKVATAMAKTESAIAKTSKVRRMFFIILSIMVMNAALIYIAIATRVIWHQVKSITIGMEDRYALYDGLLVTAELENLKKTVASVSDGKTMPVTRLASNSVLKTIGSLVFGYDYSNAIMGSQVFGILMIFVAFLLCMPGFGIIPGLSTIVKAGRIHCALLITPVWAALVVTTALLRFSTSTLYSVLLLTAAVALAFAALKLLYDRGKKQMEKEKEMLKQIGNVIEQIKEGKSIDEIDFKGKGGKAIWML